MSRMGGVLRPGPWMVALGLVCSSLTACSIRTAPFTPASAGDLASLTSRWEADRTDLHVALALASGHIEAGRLGEAEQILQSSYDRVPTSGPVAAILGMTEHRLEDYGEAYRHYGQFLDMEPYGPMGPLIEARRDAVRPHVARLEAAARVRNAARPQQRTTDPSRVAVLPFAHAGVDPAADYVTTAFAQLLTDDLGILLPSTVAADEVRALLQALEIAPTEPLPLGTALRIGALLEAGNVVFGRWTDIPDNRLRLEVTLLSISDEGPMVTDLSIEGRPGRWLDLEKRLAILVVQALRGNLSTGHAGRIVSRQVEDPLAAVAYGRGLLDADAGRHADAAAWYEVAVGIDETFDLAANLSERAGLVASVEETPLLDAVVAAVRVAERRMAVGALLSRQGPMRDAADGVGSRKRAGIGELLGRDLLGTASLFDLVLRISGGGS